MTLTKVHARKTIDISSQVKIIHYPQDMEACLNRYLKKSFLNKSVLDVSKD